MSDGDSFIEEVTEEVRRDRLFGYLRRYGWIGILAVVVIVGGTAWNEWRKAQTRQAAQQRGDAMLTALAQDSPKARAEALAALDPATPGAAAVAGLLAAAERSRQDPAVAAERLLAIADRDDVPRIYRQIATLKAVALPESGMSPVERRARVEPLTMGRGLSRLLAEEQLALIEVAEGRPDAARERLSRIVQDAEATSSLRARAATMIVALGGEPPSLPRGPSVPDAGGGASQPLTPGQ